MQFILWHFGVGDSVGDWVGDAVGDWVGDWVGDAVGDWVGDSVGDAVGDWVGSSVGDAVGDSVGDSVGDAVGDAVGDWVGAFVITQLAGRPGVPPNPVYPASHAQSQELATLWIFPHVVWCALAIVGVQGSHVPADSPPHSKRNCPTWQF